MTRFLRVFAFLSGLIFTGNALAAGYTCPTYKKYTSCNAGYYISNCGSSSNWTGQTIATSSLTTGNSCIACPSGYTCQSSAGLVCPQTASVTITYNLNGGSGTTPAATTCNPGSSCTLTSMSATTFYKAGKKLIGWSTSITATSASYTTSGTFSSNTTLYAVWQDCSANTYHPAATGTAANTCPACQTGYSSGAGASSCNPTTSTVTLNANGGTNGATTSVTATYDSAMPAIAAANLPTRAGYTFAGFYDTSAEAGGTQYYTSTGASARTWNKTGAQTLYARWTAKCIQITLNNTQNGGSGGTTTLYKRVGSTILYSDSICISTTSITKPSKTNATYGGHYNESGTQCFDADGRSLSTCNPTSDTTYYAQYDCNAGWQANGTRIAGTCLKEIVSLAYNKTLTYNGTTTSNGTAQSCANVTVTTPSSGATIEYSLSSKGLYATAAPTLTNVGSTTVYYKITATGYAERTGFYTCTMAAKNMTVSSSPKTLTYNGSAQSCGGNVSVSVPSSGATITYSTASNGTFSATAPTLTNVGSTTVYYKVNATGYNEKTGNYTCTMNAKAAVASASAKTLIYNGNAQSCANVTRTAPTDGTIKYCTTSGCTPSSTIAPTLTNVGSTTVYYTLEGTNFTKTSTNNYTCTMNRAKSVISAISAQTITYNGTKNVTVSRTGDGAVSCESSDTSVVTCSASGTTLTLASKKVGTATITVKVAQGTNHSAADNVSFTTTVNAGTITVTESNPSKTYDGTALTCNGVSATASGSTVTIKYGTASGTYNLTSAPTVTNVSDTKTIYYQVTAPNYATQTGSFTCTITKATNPIALSASDGSTTFPTAKTVTVSGAQGTVTASSSATGVATVSVSGTTVTMTPVATGTATITVSAAGNGNYNSGSKTYTLTVTNGTMTVIPSNKSKTYDGTALTCNGVSATASGSTVTIKYGTASGTYNLTSAPTVTNVSDTKTIYYQVTAPNYATQTGSFTCTITKAACTMTASTTSGSVAYPNSNTFTVSNAKGNVTVTSNNTSVATTSVNNGTVTNQSVKPGSATITATDAGNSNYEGCSKTYALTVTKGTNPITLSESSGSTAFPNAKTVTVNNAQGTVTASSSATGVATVSVSGMTVTMTPVAPGTATITVTAAGNDYYNSGSKTYALTVTKGACTLNISATSGNMAYSTTKTFTISGAKGTATVASSNTNAATASISGTTVTMTSKTTYGTSNITVTDPGNTNYESCSKTYALTVNMGTITLDNNNATPAGSEHVYQTYNTNVYIDEARSKAMTTSANAISVPTKYGYTFGGYYKDTNYKDAEQYIAANGHITSAGLTAGKALQANGIWYAKWTAKSITCDGGKYLPANSESCSGCTAGNYCAGGTFTYGSGIQGLSSCPANYANSAAGSSSQNDCYLTTTAGNFVKAAGAGQTTCEAGSYCVGGATIYYGGTVNGRNTTGGTAACSTLSGVSVTGGSYSSAAGSKVNTACKYTAPSKSIGGCSKVTPSTVTYSGTSWPASTYSVEASGGYIIAGNNTATATCSKCDAGKYSAGGTATSCETCANWTYSAAGAASCTDCLAVGDGWTKATGTGWTSFANCKGTKTGTAISSYCNAGVLTRAQSSVSAWGTPSITTPLNANSGSYVDGQTCTQCTGATYSAGGTATKCEACPAAETGWNLVGGNGLSLATQCTETTTPSVANSPIANICTAGTLTKKATNATTWGAATASGLTAKAGRYVNDITCSECAAGTYTSAATTSTSCTPAAKGYYVSASGATAQTACDAGTYTSSTGQTSCTNATAGTYTTGCQVKANASDSANTKACTGTSVCANNTYSDVKASACTACATANGYGNSGTTAANHSGVASCKVTCAGGKYVATAGAGCVDVGIGYWGAGGTVAQNATLGRTQCGTGLTTIGTGLGADEAGDCGRILHIGTQKIYLRSEKKTTPSLNVGINGTTFYGNLGSGFANTDDTQLLHIKKDGVTYKLYDDSKN